MIKLKKIFCLLIFTIFLVWIWYFINKENTIYYWGLSDYWRRYIEASNSFSTNGFIKTLAYLMSTIRHDEYNSFPIIFLFAGWIFKLISRPQYILLISVIFVGTSLLAFDKLIKKIFPTKNSLLPCLILLTTPILWSPVVNGFLDVGGLFFIFLIWKEHLSSDITNLNLKKITIRSLLLVSLVLFRRYFVYWVISYLITSGVEVLFKKDKKNFLKSIKNIFLISVISFTIYFLIAYPLSLEMIRTNYSNIYSAYKNSSNYFELLWKTFNQFGILLIATLAIGTIKYFVNKRKKNFIMIIIAQTFLTLILFFNVQDLGIQHYYLIIPLILILTLFLFFNIKNKFYKFTLIFVWFFNFIIGFDLLKFNYHKSINFLFTQTKLSPLERNDINVFNDLFKTIDNIENIDPGDIYVLASSDVINNDIIVGYCYLPNKKIYQKICDKILNSSEVDLRDGFPININKAKYILIANPIQYHLNKDDQTVIGFPAEMLLTNNGIGEYFYKLPYQFNFGENGEVVLMIYKKNKLIDNFELNRLSKMFIEKYPENKTIFTF